MGKAKFGQRREEKERIKHLPVLGQQIITVPSWRPVTNSDNDDPFFMSRGVILATHTADCKEKPPCVLLDDSEIFFFILFFASERLVVNPPALTEDCPRLRVNEVRMESR